jgi:hypothetical protein
LLTPLGKVPRDPRCIGTPPVEALAESIIGLFKPELIKPQGPWRTVEQVEIATLEWVDWFNHRRLFQTCGHIPPAELEHALPVNTPSSPRPATQPHKPPDTPGRFNDDHAVHCVHLEPSARLPAQLAQHDPLMHPS